MNPRHQATSSCSLSAPTRRPATAAVLALGTTLLLTACNGAAAPPTAVADLILTSGRVYTLSWPAPDGSGTPAPTAPHDDNGWAPDATALAIDDGIIVAVGSDAQIELLTGSTTRRIDLAGAVVVPGLVESHAHAAELGRKLNRVDLVGASPDEAVTRVAAAARDVPAGQWIQGWGFDDGAWATDGYPDHAALSAATPDHPVVLRGLHGFATWLNARAIEAAAIARATADPAGGRVLRRTDGSPTGILLDRASTLLDGVVPAESAEQLQENLRAGLLQLARDGYTSVHEAGVTNEILAALRRLDDQDRLPLPVYAMISARDPEVMRAAIEQGPWESASGRLRVRSVKAYYDAALGSRGALLLEDYSDAPGHRGTAGADYGFDEALVIEAIRAGFQIGVHAIGDAGNRDTLDFFARVFAEMPQARALRHRIEHAQILQRDDIDRLARLELLASMQPPHAVEDMAWAEARLGASRIVGAYAWRSLMRSGARVAFNSDLPGSAHDIFYGLHAAVTRSDRQAQPTGGWFPSEAVSAEEALRAYTQGGAYAAFDDQTMGVLEVGRRADITVLSVDPLATDAAHYERVLEGSVVMTIVAGAVVAGR